jgi:4-amino-4-deoxy-L-arabinose transferase-like glycosyltransferase
MTNRLTQKKLFLERSDAALFFITVLVQVLFFYFFLYGNATVTMFDSGHYHRAAISLLKNGSFICTDGAPLFYRLPGYSVFLAALYSLFGVNVWKALLLQLLLLATMPLLIKQFILLLTQRIDLARITSWLSVIAPGYMIFSGLLLTDMLFAWLFLCFCIAFLHIIDSSCTFGVTAVAGFILGFLSLIRPVGHLLLPFLLLFILLFLQASWVRKFTVAATLSGAWAVVAGSWLLRNFLLTGFVFFHTLPGPHFINHVAVRVTSIAQGVTYDQAKSAVYRGLKEKEKDFIKVSCRELSQIERCKLFEQEAVAIVKQHPKEFMYLSIINCFKTMCGLYSSELLVIDARGELPSYDRKGLVSAVKRFLWPQVRNSWIIAVIYFEILLLLLSIFGFFLAVIRYWRSFFNSRVIFTLGLIAFFIGISFACGYARLRLSIEVFYLLAASYGLNELFLQRRRHVLSHMWGKYC